jgi:hypothetical protein
LGGVSEEVEAKWRSTAEELARSESLEAFNDHVLDSNQYFMYLAQSLGGPLPDLQVQNILAQLFNLSGALRTAIFDKGQFDATFGGAASGPELGAYVKNFGWVTAFSPKELERKVKERNEILAKLNTPQVLPGTDPYAARLIQMAKGYGVDSTQDPYKMSATATKNLQDYWSDIDKDRDAAAKKAATAAKSAASKAESAAKKAAKEQETALKNVTKDVAAVGKEFISWLADPFKATTVEAKDIEATKAGKYITKWDEYARRIRAAALDAGSEWRKAMVPQDIQSQGDDSIKRWAASELDAFYKGMRPEQINWEAIKKWLENPMYEAIESGNLAAWDSAQLKLSPAIIEFGQAQGVDMIGAFAKKLGDDASAEDVSLGVGNMLAKDPVIQQYLQAGNDAGETYTNALQSYLSAATIQAPVIATPGLPESLGIAGAGATNVPHFDMGGLLRHSTGSRGRLFVGAEREDELIMPVSQLNRIKPSVSFSNTINVGVLSGKTSAIQELERKVSREQRWQAQKYLEVDR